MKSLFLFLSLAFTFTAFAKERTTIDDLSTINLNLDEASTASYAINYPNYRMGGGNAAGLRLNDCFLLDVRHSDAVVSLEDKLKLAQALKFVNGFGPCASHEKIRPSVKNDKIVFLMPPVVLYVASVRVETRSGETLNDIIKEILPAVRARNGDVTPVGLVYVRGCRF
jgi:hypothetical protein